MVACLSPYRRYIAGDDQVRYDPKTNRIPRNEVPCGRCKPCVAARKQDWSGKMLAEGLTSGATAFVTLTYKEKPKDFCYADVQAFLKRLRIWLARKHDMQARFFCVGERGDKFGRRHWHLMLFFSKPIHPSDFGQELRTVRNRFTGALEKAWLFPKGEHWEHWDHGFAQMEVIRTADRDRIMQKSRYVAKYAVKDVDGHGERPRCSLKPALGAAWFRQFAIDTAVAGLLPNGEYRLPGVFYTKGPNTGQSERFWLRGANRREFVAAWRSAWIAKHATEPPVNDWLSINDPDAAAVWLGKPGIFASLAKPVRGRWVLPDRRAAVTYKDLCLVSTGWSGTLRAFSDGSVQFIADDRVWGIDASISEVLDLLPGEVARLDAWLRHARGFSEFYNGSDHEQIQQIKATQTALSEYRASQSREDRQHRFSRVGAIANRLANLEIAPDRRTGTGENRPARCNSAAAARAAIAQSGGHSAGANDRETPRGKAQAAR